MYDLHAEWYKHETSPPPPAAGRADFDFPALKLLKNGISARQDQLPSLAEKVLEVSRNSPRDTCRTRARKSPAPCPFC